MVIALLEKPKTTRHNWTESENDLLRQEYDGTPPTITRLVGVLKLNRSQIHNHASYLGVTRHLFKTHVRWDDSPEGIQRFGELIQKYSMRKVAEIYGVRTPTIIARAARKHVNKQLRHGWYTAKDVGFVLGVNPQTVTKWIKAGVLAATNHYDKEQGYGVGASWYHIEEKDLKEFILHHRYEFYNRRVDLGVVLDIVLNGNGYKYRLLD